MLNRTKKLFVVASVMLLSLIPATAQAALPTFTTPTDWAADALVTNLWAQADDAVYVMIGLGIFTAACLGIYGIIRRVLGGRRKVA